MWGVVLRELFDLVDEGVSVGVEKFQLSCNGDLSCRFIYGDGGHRLKELSINFWTYVTFLANDIPARDQP